MWQAASVARLLQSNSCIWNQNRLQKSTNNWTSWTGEIILILPVFMTKTTMLHTKHEDGWLEIMGFNENNSNQTAGIDWTANSAEFVELAPQQTWNTSLVEIWLPELPIQCYSIQYCTTTNFYSIRYLRFQLFSLHHGSNYFVSITGLGPSDHIMWSTLEWHHSENIIQYVNRLCIVKRFYSIV